MNGSISINSEAVKVCAVCATIGVGAICLTAVVLGQQEHGVDKITAFGDFFRLNPKSAGENPSD